MGQVLYDTFLLYHISKLHYRQPCAALTGAAGQRHCLALCFRMQHFAFGQSVNNRKQLLINLFRLKVCLEPKCSDKMYPLPREEEKGNSTYQDIAFVSVNKLDELVSQIFPVHFWPFPLVPVLCIKAHVETNPTTRTCKSVVC